MADAASVVYKSIYQADVHTLRELLGDIYKAAASKSVRDEIELRLLEMEVRLLASRVATHRARKTKPDSTSDGAATDSSDGCDTESSGASESEDEMEWCVTCNEEFDVRENNETACHTHTGTLIWSCCNADVDDPNDTCHAQLHRGKLPRSARRLVKVYKLARGSR